MKTIQSTNARRSDRRGSDPEGPLKTDRRPTPGLEQIQRAWTKRGLSSDSATFVAAAKNPSAE